MLRTVDIQRRSFRVTAASFVLAVSLQAPAMDRWTALAMIESGGWDGAVGSHGEISRYQIRPELWRGGNPLNARTALANAQRIMDARVADFVRTVGHWPGDFEFYVLWNAPAQIHHPHPAVAARAKRFVNLMAEGNRRRPETSFGQPAQVGTKSFAVGNTILSAPVSPSEMPPTLTASVFREPLPLFNGAFGVTGISLPLGMAAGTPVGKPSS